MCYILFGYGELYFVVRWCLCVWGFKYCQLGLEIDSKEEQRVFFGCNEICYRDEDQLMEDDFDRMCQYEYFKVVKY